MGVLVEVEEDHGDVVVVQDLQDLVDPLALDPS